MDDDLGLHRGRRRRRRAERGARARPRPPAHPGGRRRRAEQPRRARHRRPARPGRPPARGLLRRRARASSRPIRPSRCETGRGRRGRRAPARRGFVLELADGERESRPPRPARERHGLPPPGRARASRSAGAVACSTARSATAGRCAIAARGARPRRDRRAPRPAAAGVERRRHPADRRPAGLDADEAERLRAAGVAVDEREVAGSRPGRRARAVVFADGAERACGGLLVPVVLHQRDGLAAPARRGAPSPAARGRRRRGRIASSRRRPGVFAAGDLSARCPRWPTRSPPGRRPPRRSCTAWRSSRRPPSAATASAAADYFAAARGRRRGLRGVLARRAGMPPPPPRAPRWRGPSATPSPVSASLTSAPRPSSAPRCRRGPRPRPWPLRRPPRPGARPA